ncbi:MAG: M16 family metallopeptidase [Bacteroidota bacterium]
MRNRIWLLAIGILSSIASYAQSKLIYDTVPGDPLHARIYTLENGMKVYLSVYKDAPRFQSMIGVKAGSKYDPVDHTGLAHYLEHMLFKGSDQYGTLDYAKEAPLLDSIESLYEVYGATKDPEKRKAIYHQIDSVSGVAAQYAIPNEFDKMMAALGVNGVNAFTSNEQTVYVNNVPSNQLENFFHVEAERFRNPQMRLFHTELEAVYEEKNRGLDNDGRKVFESLYEGLFPTHQYGTQTTIGTIEHLKNPSITAIKKYFHTYYVPNNMVIALSGDFDPDMAIKVINETFGQMKSKEVPTYQPPVEKLIKQPVVKEVYGPDAESITLGFRFPGAASPDVDVLSMVDMILSNGQAGLLDLNLNNAQKAIGASSSVDVMKDYSIHMLSARPREGQSLEELKTLLLNQIMEIKMGNFPDWLLPAIISNMKLDLAKRYEDNNNRTMDMIDAEVTGVNYRAAVERLDRMAKINKVQLVQFVRDWYGDNYVVVYKRTGEDKDVVKVIKPAITPVKMNTDKQSDFLKSVINKKAPSIQPVFVDYAKTIKSGTLKSGVMVYSVENKENGTFDLNFTIPVGTNHDPKWGIVAEYFKYLGAGKYSSAQLKEEFYKLGCDYSARSSEDEITFNVNGLNENLNAAVGLIEQLFTSPKADDVALTNLVDDLIKRRANAKLNKNVILGQMQNYAKFGSQSPSTNVLSEAQLKALKASDLVGMLGTAFGYKHNIDYYGPSSNGDVVTMMNKQHLAKGGLKSAPTSKLFVEQKNDTPKVFVVDYDMKQAELVFMSKGGLFDVQQLPKAFLYNRYFAGGMASPVFQTLRESKALAYAVSSRFATPNFKDRSFFNTAYIGTQVDKLPEATDGMMELLRDMPLNEKGFANAKDGAIQQLETTRITKGNLLATFHSNDKLGINYDYRKNIYDGIQNMTLTDVNNFQVQQIKPMTYTLVVLGKKDKLNMEALGKYGKIEMLKLEDIFGY